MLLYSWVFRFVISLSNSAFHNFKLWHGSMWIIFKAYSKGIYNSIFLSSNKECIKYKVERGSNSCSMTGCTATYLTQ
jgi:hypothetical protein